MQFKSDHSPEIKQEPGVLGPFQALAIGNRPDKMPDVKTEVKAEVQAEVEAGVNEDWDFDEYCDLAEEIYTDEYPEECMSDDYEPDYDWQDDDYVFTDHFEEMASAHHGFYMSNYGPCLIRGVNPKVSVPVSLDKSSFSVLIRLSLYLHQIIGF